MYDESWSLSTWTAAGSTFGLVLSVWSFSLLLYHVWKRRRKEALRERLDPNAAASASGRTLRLWHEGKEERLTVAGEEVRPTFHERLIQLRNDAGWSAPLEQFMIRLGTASLVVGIAALLVSGRAITGILSALAVPAIFWWHMNRRIAHRDALFDQQLCDGLELAARALRAGHPLLGALQLIGEEVPPPVGTVFAEICQQNAMGVRLEDALSRAATLTKSPDVKLLSTSLAIHLKAGGNMADVIQGLAVVIRERMRLSRRFKVLTAQTQFSKRILVGLPFAMFFVLQAISPTYMAPLYSTRIGNFLLAGACTSLFLGWWVMNKMADLRR